MAIQLFLMFSVVVYPGQRTWVTSSYLSMTASIFAFLDTSRHVFSWVALPVMFLVLWVLVETARGGDGRPLQAHQDGLDFAASDLLKSVLSLSLWFGCRQLQGIHSLSTIVGTSSGQPFDPRLPTCNFHALHQGLPASRSCSNYRELHPRSSIFTSTFGSVRQILPFLFVVFIHALRAYTDLATRELVDPLTLCLAFPMVALGILLILQIISWRNFPAPFWHAAVLQFAGFFITRDALGDSALPPCSLLIAFALCNSMWVSLVDLVYGTRCSSSIHLTNTIIFAQSSLIHSLLSLLHPSPSVSHPYINRFSAALQALSLIGATKDVVAMFIIRQYGAISYSILVCLASTFLIAVEAWKFIQLPYSALLGCLIALFGFGIYAIYGKHTGGQQAQHDPLASARRCFAASTMYLVAFGYIVAVTSQYSGTNSLDLFPARTKSSGLSRSRPDCRIPELPSQTIANYAHFNNVLLIVFFSHARYNANLDFHREVYADYFPNIVYIGPASREDKGFAHSYDVHVDSFQSEEDLNDPLFYKMSGRMAHHMLYTALREYGCYDGYLWVPFDTLLNIPRLQQFNQSLFWYHSPWGQPVPNPALGDFAIPALNMSRHAPPALISPDPSINLTQGWRGWGPDWWWGDPHVGVSVCMNAFRKVPEDMRAHLAELNNGQTRLIGGSADTLYIPGRHRKAFMEVLALFLETDCFLEIATPTTVHLVVPRGESIQFVDHWWIYEPPFNASFVRQKWAQGYEVDTFHTFHWGERDQDGIWRGDHRHVADVRYLLRESAIRQGLNDTFPVNSGGS